MRKSILILFGFMLTACANSGPNQLTLNDTEASGAKLKSFVPSSSIKSTGMVVTANPHATKAGSQVLRAGGSAVDAAIAIQAVLSLVEPQSSGLGGGGFMVHFNNEDNNVTVYDGRETAPMAISQTQFLDETGKSIGYLNAKHSGLSTGVPGMVALLKMAHDDYGQLAWGSQFDAAKKLANDGFAISPRLSSLINRFGKYLPKTPEEGPVDAYQYFFDKQGEPLPIGAILKNTDYAETLAKISKDPDAFYRGEIAEEIVAQTSIQPRAGSLSIDDMKNFKPQKRQALCSSYANKQVCGPPPPSSWLAVGQIMGLIDTQRPFDNGGAASPKNWVQFAEMQRLAYSDRDQYVGDSEFVDVPVAGLLSPEYWQARVRDTNVKKASEALTAGDPWAYDLRKKVAYGTDSTVDVAGTTHFVVVDAKGNVVSLTASVESIFGSARMAGGMFLNNQLTDFSFKPFDDSGNPVANRIEPGKRPRSSMSPTIVLDENGEFLMATGSPGGNSIIAYTAKTLVGVFEWGLSAQEAVELPNMVARGSRVRIEKDRASEDLINELKNYGFNVKESAGENSGLSVVVKGQDGSLSGGVDSRREGTIELVEF